MYLLDSMLRFSQHDTFAQILKSKRLKFYIFKSKRPVTPESRLTSWYVWFKSLCRSSPPITPRLPGQRSIFVWLSLPDLRSTWQAPSAPTVEMRFVVFVLLVLQGAICRAKKTHCAAFQPGAVSFNLSLCRCRHSRLVPLTGTDADNLV